MKLSQDLKEFVELLNSNKVEYLLVGGHAVAYHGWPRFTQDIDFFVRPTRENGERLVQTLRQFGVASPELTSEVFTQPKKNIQLGQPPHRIDLLTWLSGTNFDEAWASHVSATMGGLVVPVIGKDILIVNKRASGRSKDLADLDHLDNT